MEQVIFGLIKNISFTTILIFFLIIILLFVVYICLISVSRKRTEWNIKKYEKSHKYIKELFIEINDYKEYIRYFIFGKKWTKRIRYQFNNLFKIKPKFLDFKSITSHIYFFYNFNKTLSIIKKQYNIFKEAYKNKRNIALKEYPDAKYKAEDYSYWMQKDLNKLNKYCRAINSNFFIITGNAGSGKSNLLCNIAELIIANEYPCVFINLKDIDVDIYEYFYEYLPLKNVLKFIQNKTFNIVSIVSIINFMCMSKRKNFFVLLDALNENNDNKFLNALCKFINTLLEKKSFKVILTCRSEYFDTHYNKILEKNINMDKMEKLDISNNTINFSNRDKYKLHYAYKKHFNFKGNISNFIYDKLSQLLLIRILYETNKDSRNNIIDLNKFKIYKKYISLISEDNKNFETLLTIITQKMIDSLNFNYILIKDLNLKEEDLLLLKKICDENMLITRKLIENEDKINEDVEETISFVFDELRDYCITKIAINNINQLFDLLNILKEKLLPPLEGVITYSYLHFREIEEYDMCKRIVENYLTIKELPFSDFEQHLDFGMNMIFEHGKKLLDFEKKYIFDVLNKNRTYQLLKYFIINILRICKFDKDSFYVVFEFLMTIKSFSCIEKIFNFILSTDIVDDEKSLYIAEKLLDEIKEKVTSNKHVKILSEIIYDKYQFNELDVKELNLILKESQCDEIKDRIKNIMDMNK